MMMEVALDRHLPGGHFMPANESLHYNFLLSKNLLGRI